jgi:hypothetical protein
VIGSTSGALTRCFVPPSPTSSARGLRMPAFSVQHVIASAAKQSPAFRAPARHAGDCFAALAMTCCTLSDAVTPGRTPSYAAASCDRRSDRFRS